MSPRACFQVALKALAKNKLQTALTAIGLTIGVATVPDAGQRWDELFKAADEALYVSKRSGRNRTTAWSAALRSSGGRTAA